MYMSIFIEDISWQVYYIQPWSECKSLIIDDFTVNYKKNSLNSVTINKEANVNP